MIINTGLLAFAQRDGSQHKAAGVSWQMSTRSSASQ